MENLFNALCATLMTPKNRQVFVDAEGVELMVLILKQKKVVRASALKALVGPFPVQFSTVRFKDIRIRSPANPQEFWVPFLFRLLPFNSRTVRYFLV